MITNRELYFRDPTTLELLNNGVSKVSEFGHDTHQIKTLRFELETFVCDGEYARGLERILKAYIDGLSQDEQKAVWVSGFFGSGKSHLVKVLRYLWEDYHFADGATARSLVKLPLEITDLLTELTNRSKPLGGLRAAAGTLGAGSMDNVRLALVQLVLRSAGLPEDLAQAKFLLWLRSSPLHAPVTEALKKNGCDLREEVASLNYSVPLAEALLSADPKYGTVANVQEVIRTGFPEITSPTIAQALDFLQQIFGQKGKLPCTLLVVDEIQQFIGEKIQRAMDLQEIAEACSTKLNQRLLLIGTGQSALNTTPSLQRLQARFTVRVQLSDADVESVIRKTVLRKKPEQDPVIAKRLSDNQGEIARHLQNTRFAANHEDDKFFVADYPLLPTRRRFWEKVLRNTDHSGTKAQLRSQLQIVFEATRQTAAAAVGTVVPADFIYDQISTDLLNSGELEREYDEIIRKQRDGSKEGSLRSSVCALIFLIGKLPRTPGADDGVRANAETLIDLLVSDLKNDRPRLEEQVPTLLKQLVDAGQLMGVDTEFRLQTREGTLWTHDFNHRRTAVLADDERINSKRAELLRDGTKQALKPVSLQQGTSRHRLKPEEEWPDGDNNVIIYKTESVIVELTTDVGLKGIGGASRYNGPAEMKDYAETVVKPVILGKNPFDVEYLAAGLCGPRARGVWAGVDTAMWDIIGKAKGLPLYKILATDTEPVTHIRMYASGGEFTWHKGSRFVGPDDLVKQALRHKAAGYTAFKYRPGGGFGRLGIKMADYIPYMRELRKAVGPDFDLIQEANTRWSMEQCIEVAPVLEELKYLWFEEPTRKNIEDYVKLKNYLPTVKISGGETMPNRATLSEWVDRGAYDIVQPGCDDAGMTECWHMARTAASRGKLICPHNWQDGLITAANAHLLAAVPNRFLLESNMTPNPFKAGLGVVSFAPAALSNFGEVGDALDHPYWNNPVRFGPPLAAPNGFEGSADRALACLWRSAVPE